MAERRFIELGVRSVSRRGGSLQVTLPSQVVKIMKLVAGDKIVFYYDSESRRIFIARIPKAKLESIVDLEFSLPKES